mmetsp:Transcript_12452/g.39852  ORF Transcript_12452/g.39852 Transcript_12452/m.39852 type:complete len:215 (+) Transcript_12452:123-767(+)
MNMCRLSVGGKRHVVGLSMCCSRLPMPCANGEYSSLFIFCVRRSFSRNIISIPSGHSSVRCMTVDSQSLAKANFTVDPSENIVFPEISSRLYSFQSMLAEGTAVQSHSLRMILSGSPDVAHLFTIPSVVVVSSQIGRIQRLLRRDGSAACIWHTPRGASRRACPRCTRSVAQRPGAPVRPARKHAHHRAICSAMNPKGHSASRAWSEDTAPASR